MIPPPVVETHNGFRVVREDFVEGGTKRRLVDALLDDTEEYVYASPRQGFAQLAIALACRDAGKKATIFLAKGQHTNITKAAIRAGAKVVEVPMGFLNVTQHAARMYALGDRGRRLLPFGMDSPVVRNRLVEVAQSLPFAPHEVWTVAGSGMLTRSLQKAWPAAKFYVVKVGKDKIDTGRATIIRHPFPFHRDAKVLPPFDSCSNYDAKAWEFMLERASPGALFWNVAGNVRDAE